MRKIHLALLITVVSVPRPVFSQGDPLGPEFRVNTYTTSQQDEVAVATFERFLSTEPRAPDTTGNFVVVWGSYGQDGSSGGVFGQRFLSTGAPLGPEFRVNTYTTNTQRFPSVATDGFGGFVVVWESGGQDGSSYGVFGQRFAISGAPLGPEFRVNTYTTLQQGGPAVTSDLFGNFVVVYNSNGPDGDDYGIFGQRFASSGAPLGVEFRVNTYTTSYQVGAAVATELLGSDFAVVWRSNGQDGSYPGVFGQRFSNAGTPVGAEFRVNTFTTGYQGDPSIGRAQGGDFVVVWASYGQDGADRGVFGQRFEDSGSPLGPEFRVNTYTTSYQGGPSVASDSGGNFVVVWGGYFEDGSSTGVFGQRYTNAGNPHGAEFRANTFTTAGQELPAVAAVFFGDFVVVWRSYGQDGSSHGVFGQRFSQIVPVQLMRFGVE